MEVPPSPAAPAARRAPGDSLAPEWLPCSDRSLQRGDPLAGTAGLGQRWLLVEIESSWGRHAFFDSALDPRVGAALVRRAEAAGIRPLAIRRTGLRAPQRRTQMRWRWALADARPGRQALRWGSVADPAELLDLPLDGSAGDPSSEPLFVVCTHARHDQCCAVRGRPVVAAFAAAHPESTWECSHLGGDRFAATMLVLPQGLLYGRVEAADVEEIASASRRGRVVSRLLRGRTSLTAVAQAAEAFAREAIGDDRAEAFRVLGEHAHPHGWRVELEHDGDTLVVEVGERVSAPLLSTCEATVAHPVREYAAVSIGPAQTV